jgi:hypothetical protein
MKFSQLINESLIKVDQKTLNEIYLFVSSLSTNLLIYCINRLEQKTQKKIKFKKYLQRLKQNNYKVNEFDGLIEFKYDFDDYNKELWNRYNKHNFKETRLRFLLGSYDMTNGDSFYKSVGMLQMPKRTRGSFNPTILAEGEKLPTVMIKIFEIDSIDLTSRSFFKVPSSLEELLDYDSEILIEAFNQYLRSLKGIIDHEMSHYFQFLIGKKENPEKIFNKPIENPINILDIKSNSSNISHEEYQMLENEVEPFIKSITYDYVANLKRMKKRQVNLDDILNQDSIFFKNLKSKNIKKYRQALTYIVLSLNKNKIGVG